MASERGHTWRRDRAVVVSDQQHGRPVLLTRPAYVQDDVADVVVGIDKPLPLRVVGAQVGRQQRRQQDGVS